jgi:hypothetical protein
MQASLVSNQYPVLFWIGFGKFIYLQQKPYFLFAENSVIG